MIDDGMKWRRRNTFRFLLQANKAMMSQLRPDVPSPSTSRRAMPSPFVLEPSVDEDKDIFDRLTNPKHFPASTHRHLRTKAQDVLKVRKKNPSWHFCNQNGVVKRKLN